MKCLVSVMKKVHCAPFMSTVLVIKKNICSIKNLRDPDILPELNSASQYTCPNRGASATHKFKNSNSFKVQTKNRVFKCF